ALLVLTPKSSLDAIGLLAALGSTTVFAIGTVLVKRWGRPASLVAFTGWQLAFGGLMLVPLWLAVEGVPDHLGGDAIGGFLYLTLANPAIAYALWFQGIDRLTATAVSFLTLLAPIVAAVLGYVVLGQTLTALQLSGMVLAGVGIVGGQLVAAPRAR